MAGAMSGIGKVVLSVDLPSESATRGRPQDSLASTLFQMVESRRLPATWVPREPRQCSLYEKLAAAPARHDMALAGDATWIGKAAGRTRFARELAARVEAVRSAHVNVSAIALHDVELDDHLDLLVKHRVGMIRGQLRGGTSLQPQSVRFGVWYSPISVVLPKPADWSWFGQNWSLRQTVRRAIRAEGVAHLVVDATQMAGNSAALGELDLALAHLQRQRDKGVLAVLSLSGLAASLVRRPAAKKATSILKAA